MDSFEFNKMAGAVLAALLLAVGTTTFIGIRVGHDKLEKPGYKLPVVAAPAPGEAAKPAEAFSPEKVVAQVQQASADAGQAAFKKCATCHTPAKGGRNGTGPNLWGIVGRDIGDAPGFNYSDALKSKEGNWTYEHLAQYLHDPKGYIPGNKMAFAGVRDNTELADLLAYLRTLSDNPPPLPQ
jgi:cytochrome c